jgi:tRNA threonylcarbamoyladenosine biosynthesis protein TsaB
VANLLAEQGWRPRDLDVVMVSHGPGSYTGLRVGIMSAKALAYATGCALLAIDTFSAIASQAPPDAEFLDVLADAQQDQVYVRSFGRHGLGVQPLTDLVIRPFAEWLADRSARHWITGPWLQKWEKRLPPDAMVVDSASREPQPRSLLQLGMQRFQAGERDEVWGVEPLYLRASSAEEQWRRRQA